MARCRGRGCSFLAADPVPASPGAAASPTPVPAPSSDDLETELLQNEASSRDVFERIFAKYNREYRRGEVGGELIDFHSREVFEVQLQKLFVTPKPEANSSSNVSSCSDDEGGGCISNRTDARQWRRRNGRGQYTARPVEPCVPVEPWVGSVEPWLGPVEPWLGPVEPCVPVEPWLGPVEPWLGPVEPWVGQDHHSVRCPQDGGLVTRGQEGSRDQYEERGPEPDQLLTARLHRKVLEIKQEMNWDEEERLERERKVSEQVPSSSSEDELYVADSRFTKQQERGGSDIQSGLESGYVECNVNSGYVTSGLESGYVADYSVVKGRKRRKRTRTTRPVKRTRTCTSTPHYLPSTPLHDTSIPLSPYSTPLHDTSIPLSPYSAPLHGASTPVRLISSASTPLHSTSTPLRLPSTPLRLPSPAATPLHSTSTPVRLISAPPSFHTSLPSLPCISCCHHQKVQLGTPSLHLQKVQLGTPPPSLHLPSHAPTFRGLN